MVFLLHLPLNQNLKSIQNRNQKSSLEKKTVFSLHFPCESDLSGLTNWSTISLDRFRLFFLFLSFDCSLLSLFFSLSPLKYPYLFFLTCGNEHKIKVCLYILGDLSVCLSLTCFTVCTCTLL